MTYKDVMKRINYAAVLLINQVEDAEGNKGKGKKAWESFWKRFEEIKAGNYTLKELVEIAEKAKDTRLAVVDKDQSLPENPNNELSRYDDAVIGYGVYDTAQQDMFNAGWIKESK